jgi:hypothetical protein
MLPLMQGLIAITNTTISIINRFNLGPKTDSNFMPILKIENTFSVGKVKINLIN